MAQATAGFSFTPTDKKELGIGWEYIAWELRHQYRIGFHPTPTTEKDHWSNVTVKLMAPSIGERRLPMSIRTKGGYFQPQLAAPAQP
jgi:hypothetical protein